MENKGVINIEILILVMILLIIFTMLISLSMTEYSTINETQKRKESRIIVSDISKIINKVYIQEEGYSTNFHMPEKINDNTYIAYIDNSGIYINSYNQKIVSKYYPSNIIKKRTNLIPGQNYEFKKNNYSIEISEIK